MTIEASDEWKRYTKVFVSFAPSSEADQQARKVLDTWRAAGADRSTEAQVTIEAIPFFRDPLGGWYYLTDDVVLRLMQGLRDTIPGLTVGDVAFQAYVPITSESLFQGTYRDVAEFPDCIAKVQDVAIPGLGNCQSQLVSGPAELIEGWYEYVTARRRWPARWGEQPPLSYRVRRRLRRIFRRRPKGRRQQ